MFDELFVLLSLLFVKHWYIDFVNQSEEEVKGKGIYGNLAGIGHSFKHGLATFIILSFFIQDLFLCMSLGVMDFVIHYHTDWAKMKFGNRDITTKEFWAQLGLDQLVHSLTYVLIIWMLL